MGDDRKQWRSMEAKNGMTVHDRMVIVIAVALLSDLVPGPAWAQNSARGRMWTEALKGAALAADGKLDQACVRLDRARRWKNDVAVRAALALCHLAAGRPTTARLMLEKLARTAGELPAVQYWLARLLARRSPVRACHAMNAALSLGGDLPRYLVGKALLCRSVSHAAAVDSLALAASKTWDIMDPRLYPDPVAGLIDMVDQALRTFPNKQQVLLTLAHLYVTAHRLSSAEATARRVIATWGHVHEAYFVLARARYLAGDYKAAATWVERTLGSDPSDPQALALRAALSIREGKIVRARSDLERSVRADPTDAVNLARLGHLYWKTGAYPRAEKMFRYSLARMPSLATAHHGLALALARRRKFVEAERQHRLAIAGNPVNALYRRGYAQFLQQRGKAAAARQLAVAKSLERQYARFAKTVMLAQAYRRQVLALHGGRVVRSWRGPAAPRFFILAGITKTQSDRRRKAARALSGLKARKLLGLDSVVVLQHSGRLRGGPSFLYRQYLDFVRPSLLR
ncbi:MAG: tetratricopeptide repeat protein [Deltaproteobacteria bacterium]|nr:tetratricopeptide repeat protein [Deltaproteobacteria bacterium]